MKERVAAGATPWSFERLVGDSDKGPPDCAVLMLSLGRLTPVPLKWPERPPRSRRLTVGDSLDGRRTPGRMRTRQERVLQLFVRVGDEPLGAVSQVPVVVVANQGHGGGLYQTWLRQKGGGRQDSRTNVTDVQSVINQALVHAASCGVTMNLSVTSYRPSPLTRPTI